MAAPTDLSVLLRLYTGKQNSPTVIVQDFCDYLQKYSRHYLQEVPDLVMYLDDTATTVLKELEALEIKSKVFLSSDLKGRKLVFVPQYYIDRVLQRFREIEEKPEIPYPLSTELPSGYPAAFLKPIYITTDFSALIEDGSRTNAYMYQLNFPDETPPMIYPASLSPEKLLDLALSKIRLFLRKDESKDYIQKRMMIANPGKEMTIKNTLIQFQTRPSESLRALKHSGEAFLFWSYLCSFIRQDYAKKNEKTPEETGLIQSVFITEYLNNFYKNKAQQDIQRQTALKNLELCFQKPPYFFDMESITRFTDSRGVPLLGQYRDTDLEAFIKEKTGESNPDALPALLVFKTETGNRYFILKEKVIPLSIKLCNDGRKVIKDQITREWFQTLKAYSQDNAMKTQVDFERKVEALCKSSAPVLHALLNASFMSLMAMEESAADRDAQNGFRMFDRGRLLPLSELLLLNRQELLTDTRIMLPFWYTIPVISAIIAFFNRPRMPHAGKKKAVREAVEEQQESRESSKVVREDRKAELKNAAAQIEKKLIPEGSDLETETTTQLELWNRTLDPKIKENLTEDVNSLIRDYIRRVIRTIKASTFDLARVENLSATLVATPGLSKIKNKDALQAYIKLYILKLVRGLT